MIPAAGYLHDTERGWSCLPNAEVRMGAARVLKAATASDRANCGSRPCTRTTWTCASKGDAGQALISLLSEARASSFSYTSREGAVAPILCPARLRATPSEAGANTGLQTRDMGRGTHVVSSAAAECPLPISPTGNSERDQPTR